MNRLILGIGIAAVTFVATATPARASELFQGLTFTFTQTDADTLTFRIEGTPTDDWTGVQYLGAFDLKGTGLDFDNAPADTATANGPGAVNLLGLNSQLSASNLDCSKATGQADTICFDLSPDHPITAPLDLLYTIDFSAPLAIGDEGIHLQIAFTNSVGGDKVGSLYSQDVALSTTTTSTTTTVSGTSSELPEPTVLSLLGAALLGAGYRLRRRRA